MKSSVIRSGRTIDRGVRTRENLVVGMSATVCGGVDAGGNLSLGHGALVTGDLRIGGDLVLGPRAKVMGRASVRGSAILLPGSGIGALEADGVEMRRARADEVHSSGDLVLVEAEVSTFSADGKVVAQAAPRE
ncbi:MAG: UDP-3-O-(3-hydroxymyristoyl)glucosamine N-acyltransferase [Methanonatronarchaeales archaeon]|nr:UDP-3-O-(3-hydroxymyristoyl)glucosamine N-acyltransferase [Methanonatronarchaeales archaeon]